MINKQNAFIKLMHFKKNTQRCNPKQGKHFQEEN